MRGSRPPACWPCRSLYYFVTSPAFDGAITVVIVANIALMACDFWRIEQYPMVDGAYEGGLLLFT